eukprot:TRINITY_DN35379_c0_g1_i1.p1 TRINITY_DN35379_c0_g1~~TRINITY_DN35379_c0_g1_i1.p1  ORF type:complete len:596 (-),score=105.26 TRINITY_DN35379_c0_g1_i1:263-1951(-)
MRAYKSDVSIFGSPPSQLASPEDDCCLRSDEDRFARPRKMRRLTKPVASNSTVHSMDLEDIGPALMFSPLIGFTKAVFRALVIVTQAVIPMWLIVVWALGGAALAILHPRFFAGMGVVTALVVTLMEICWSHWLQGVKRQLEPMRFAAQRLAPPGSAWDVFMRTVEAIEESDKAARSHKLGRTSQQWLQDWFLGSEFSTIKRDNAADFFTWAFLTKLPEELDETDQALVSRMFEVCETRFGWQFEEGRTPGVKPIRISFDKMQAYCHPMLYYAGVRLLHLATRQSLRLLGFSHYDVRGRCPPYFHKAPLREEAVLILDGAERQQPPPPPVVFLHGVGVGLSPYLPFIRRMARERECFVVEIPTIAQCCDSDVLTPAEMVEAMELMLKAHGHSSAVFMAHSFGTCVLSWLCRMRPSMVSQAVFIDPVCFGLCHPDVAYNFLYKEPDDAFLHVAAHFVRWELFTANVLYRNFYWYHNTLWTDEIPEGSVIALSGADAIINAPLVRHHLENHQRKQTEAGEGSPSTVASEKQAKTTKILWFDRFLHGSFLVSKPAQLQILSWLQQ